MLEADFDLAPLITTGTLLHKYIALIPALAENGSSREVCSGEFTRIGGHIRVHEHLRFEQTLRIAHAAANIDDAFHGIEGVADQVDLSGEGHIGKRSRADDDILSPLQLR